MGVLKEIPIITFSLRCTRHSLGPRPSPLRDLLSAFNCAGEGNIPSPI